MLRSPFILVTAVAALGVAACDSPADVHQHDVAQHDQARPFDALASAKAVGLAKDVRRVTSRYHSTEQALKDGYAPDEFCVAVPGVGGMGYHWLNAALVDPVFQPLRPEVVLYEPGPNGTRKLVAVEYIVIDVGQPAPTFGGQPFDVGGTPVPVPHWSLHVWLHKENPNGLFAPFNPRVSCP